jgi:hypothetical protein
MEASHTEFLAATCFREMEHQWKVNPKVSWPLAAIKTLVDRGKRFIPSSLNLLNIVRLEG